MTVTEAAKKYLVDRGMFPEQADKVVALVKQDSANEVLKDRWEDSIDGYPKSIFAILSISIDSNALAWIDENKPKAWFRDIFLPASKQETQP